MRIQVGICERINNSWDFRIGIDRTHTNRKVFWSRKRDDRHRWMKVVGSVADNIFFQRADFGIFQRATLELVIYRPECICVVRMVGG